MTQMDWIVPEDLNRLYYGRGFNFEDCGCKKEIPAFDDREKVLELQINSDDDLVINNPDENVDL